MIRFASMTLIALTTLAASAKAQELDSVSVTLAPQRSSASTAALAPLPDARRRARVVGGAALGVVLVGGVTTATLAGGLARCDDLDCILRPILGGAAAGLLLLPAVPLLAERLGHRAGGHGRFDAAMLGGLVGMVIGGLSFATLPLAEHYERALGIMGAITGVSTVAGTVIGYELSHGKATSQPTIAIGPRGGRLGWSASF